VSNPSEGSISTRSPSARPPQLLAAAAPVVVLVTDPGYALERTVEIVREAARVLGPNRLLVQLRDNENGPVVIRAAARVLREVTREEGALFVINGATSIAQDVEADGVHLPNDRGALLSARIASARRMLGEHAFVTAAAHDEEDVRGAIEGNASAVLVSPIFATPGKGPPRGVEALAAARALVDAARNTPPLLVYALGGVGAASAAACAAAGADGVAAIRALYETSAADLEATVRAMAAPFRSAGGSRAQ
jgi:thiamine-phosphate pyrophosphorylase